MAQYIYIALTILLTIYGQIIIKWRVNFHAALSDHSGSSFTYVLSLLIDPYVISGLFAAFLASCTWMLAVSRMQLSKAYPFVAMSFVLVPVASWLFLSEALTARTFAGAALIIFGIAISVS